MHGDTNYVGHQQLLKLFGFYEFDILLWGFQVLSAFAASAKVSFMNLLYFGEFFKDCSEGRDIETFKGCFAQSIN